MKKLPLGTIVSLILSTGIQFSNSAPSPEWNKNWPQWRGPTANGTAPEANPPLEWSETKNVKWKVAVPGFGSSTPIIWNNQVFITTALGTGKKVEPAKTETAQPEPPPGDGSRRGGRPGRGEEKPTEIQEFVVLCLDRTTGKTVWQKTVKEELPHEGHHKDHGFASASVVTDGEHLIAFFGSRGLYGMDLKGKVLWEKQLGQMKTRNGFGEGASPVLHGKYVIVNWDHEGPDDFIVAFDKTSGKELWRQKREEATGWSTPLIVKFDGKEQVIVNATGKIRSYELETGKQIWECGGQTVNAIPSPVSDGQMVYVMSGFRGNNLQAIKLGKTGDLTGTDAIAWTHNKNTPYVPSPLLTENFLYFLSNNSGILSCWDTSSGKPLIDAERLEALKGVYASPVSAKDRVYVLDREGTTLVLKKGPKVEILATNKLDDRTDATMAIAGNEIFIRGHKNLYCVSGK